MNAKDALPVKSTEICQKYTLAAKRIDADVKTERTIRDRLSKLKLKGFLIKTRENRGEGGDIDPTLVNEVLLGVDRLDDLFEGSQEDLTAYSE